MRGRHVSAEEFQGQLVVCVMPCVLDLYVLEQTNVCDQDIIGPGAHIPAAPMHDPCTAVLQPRLLLREEVAAHVLQYLFCHGICNPLVPLPSLWCNQVGVEIYDQ